jgi:hypothetical protein
MGEMMMMRMTRRATGSHREVVEMLRRKVEEVDDSGRRRVFAAAEPSHYGVGQAHNGEVLGEEEEVIRSRGTGWDFATGWVRTFGLWIVVVLAAVETALAFRLGLLLAGANPSNGFVEFIYDVSAPLADPFEGIFSNRAVSDGLLESAAVVAMVVYLAGVLLLVAALWALAAVPSPAGDRSVISRSHRRTNTVRED